MQGAYISPPLPSITPDHGAQISSTPVVRPPCSRSPLGPWSFHCEPLLIACPQEGPAPTIGGCGGVSGIRFAKRFAHIVAAVKAAHSEEEAKQQQRLHDARNISHCWLGQGKKTDRKREEENKGSVLRSPSFCFSTRALYVRAQRRICAECNAKKVLALPGALYIRAHGY